MPKPVMLGAKNQRESPGVCKNPMSLLGTPGWGGIFLAPPPSEKWYTIIIYVKPVAYIVKHIGSTPCQCEKRNLKMHVGNEDRGKLGFRKKNHGEGLRDCWVPEKVAGVHTSSRSHTFASTQAYMPVCARVHNIFLSTTLMIASHCSPGYVIPKEAYLDTIFKTVNLLNPALLI